MRLFPNCWQVCQCDLPSGGIDVRKWIFIVGDLNNELVGLLTAARHADVRVYFLANAMGRRPRTHQE